MGNFMSFFESNEARSERLMNEEFERRDKIAERKEREMKETNDAVQEMIKKQKDIFDKEIEKLRLSGDKPEVLKAFEEAKSLLES